PSPQDVEGWRRAIEANRAMWEPIASEMLAASRCSAEPRAIAGVNTYVCTPSNRGGDARCLYLYIHGGAFVFGSGRFAMATGAKACDGLGVTTVSVDYRMPPDHPFPAALEDAFAVYRSLLEGTPGRRILIGGSSAGGNIAAAVTL